MTGAKAILDLYAEGLARLKARDSFGAVAALEQARLLGGEGPLVDLALMAAYRRDARYGDALDLGRLILERDPANIEARFETAVCLARDGAAEAALAAFDAVIALNPDHAAAWYDSHGPALDLLGTDEALRRVAMAASRPRANGRYWAMDHALKLLSGREAEAEVSFEAHLSHHPNRRPLADALRALAPHLGANTRIFGVSAHLLRFAVAQAGQPGLVLEFGVRRGTSLFHVALAAGGVVHGFDSFEGLPEEWRNHPAGNLTTGAVLPAVPANARLHAGWFEDSLPAFLERHPGPVRFVNIDSDLYSSAATVLGLLEPRFKAGSVVVFDEMIGNPSWKEDEHRAFVEFLERSGLAADIVAIAPFTKQVAVRLR